MQAFVTLALVVVFLAVGSVAVNYVSRLPSRRPSTYVSYCASRGYEFVPQRDGAQAQYAGLVPIFGRIGFTRSWRNEISGTIDGRHFVAFEYTYAIGGARGASTYHSAMVKWDLPGAGLANFKILPSDFFQLTSGVRKAPASTMTVPTDPEFSRAFMAVGEKRSLDRLLTSDLRAAMVERSDNHLAGSVTSSFGGLTCRSPVRLEWMDF